MKPGTRLLVSIVAGIIAVLLMGAFAVSLAGSYSAQRNKAIRQYGGTVTEVYVAKNNIKSNAVITPDMYEKRKWVADLLPAGAITDAKMLKSAKTNALILAGEPITKSRLGDTGTALVEVPSGLVAISISTEPVLAVGGAVRGGNRVSLIVADGKNDPYRLADGVLVVSTSADGASSGTGGVFSGSDSGAGLSWVTLAVDPQLVLPLVNVADTARIHLVMAGQGASTTTTSTGQ